MANDTPQLTTSVSKEKTKTARYVRGTRRKRLRGLIEALTPRGA